MMYAPIANSSSLNHRKQLHNSSRLIRNRIEKRVSSSAPAPNSCCFAYSYSPVKSSKRQSIQHDDPYKTPPSGLYIEDSHYKPGSPRRRKDRTFNVLCQVREVLHKQYRLPFPATAAPSFAKRFKVLSQFFGIEPEPLHPSAAPRPNDPRPNDPRLSANQRTARPSSVQNGVNYGWERERTPRTRERKQRRKRHVNLSDESAVP